jgi:hydrogenase-4 component E
MPPHVPSVATGIEDIIAVLVLVTEFGMLRAPLLRSQVRLYAFQSLAVSVLAVVVAAATHTPDIYAVAGLSFLLKVAIVPTIMMRLLKDVDVNLVGSSKFGVASSFLVALGATVFGFFSVGSLHVRSSHMSSPTTLAISSAVVLVAFVLIVLRSDVVSQAVGFFSLENGVSVASLVIAANLPLVAAALFLFDLLVAVVAFGIIARVHHGHARTLFTDKLDKLRG